ncbi:MAG: hypothetical protein WAV76_00595 [Bacteroidota bacterium]
MKNFSYWKKQHESERLEEFNLDTHGLLWLKIKSIARKDILVDFANRNNIQLKETSLSAQFVELYDALARNPSKSHRILDGFIHMINDNQAAKLNADQLVSELYKMKVFDWGGDYQNSLDKYLVTHYVKALRSYDTLMSKFETEINIAVQGYVLNSWYNHWSSILVEHIFKSHKAVLPTVGQIKHVDFFIRNIPFDLKVTYLPAEYIKDARKKEGLPVELTYLKTKAMEMDITFDRHGKPNDIQYEITEKLKDRNDEHSRSVLDTLRKQKLKILAEAKDNPQILAKWLYENQGEMRFGSENRIFIVLVDTEDFENSWKLKRNSDLLRPAIIRYLNAFGDKKLNNLKISFKYKDKPQTFTSLTDMIFVVK